MSKARKRKSSTLTVSLPREIVRILDELVKENYDSRSGFIKRLILKEAKLAGKSTSPQREGDEP